MRIALFAFLVAQTLLSAPSDLDVRLTKEIERLDGVLKSMDTTSPDIKPMIEGNRVLLDRARNATTPVVRLYRMRDAFVGIETLRYDLEHKSAEKSLDSVKSLAKSSRAAILKPLTAMSAPALQLALRQIAANRAQKLLNASVPYGKAASPASGLFYLGEAEGNRRFRDFVEKLPLGTSAEPRPNAGAVQATLAKLDDVALKVYADEPATRATATLSSRLKEARELSDRGWLEGAALTLIEAQIDLQRRGMPVAIPKTTPTAKDSIATMLSDENSAVLPLYASLFDVAPVQKKIPKNVTVTLVRWPYT